MTDTTHLRTAVEELLPTALAELATLVSMRSVADPEVEDPAELGKAANWVAAALGELGLETELARTPDGTDAVIARHTAAPDLPKVLLYAHYDVQPAPADGWRTDPWTLTESGGRYYGRGAADCKGNIMAHLTALRALKQVDGEFPCSITVVVEGSEEQGTAGLEDYVRARPEEFAADAIIIGDVGNLEVGVPTLTVALRGMASVIVNVATGTSQLHSGAFGGAAPDALAALITILSSMYDEAGNTTIDGLDNTGVWQGAQYDEATFRSDAGTLPGVERIGTGTVADQVWARPAATVLGIDAPAVIGAVPAIQPTASAHVSLRVPPGIDAEDAQSLLIAHLEAAAPWGAQVECERAGIGSPYAAAQDSRAFHVLSAAMGEAFDAPVQTSGQGGSIPLTAALSRAHPDAAIVMIGVADPACKMHAENESVHPGEIAGMALAEALFLRNL